MRVIKRLIVAVILSIPVFSFTNLQAQIGEGVELLTAIGQKVGLSVPRAFQQTGAGGNESCGHHYVQGIPPRIDNQRLARHTRALCSEAFSTVYSGVARSPLWSAQLLTPGQLARAKEVGRTDIFNEDRRLPSSWRARLEDFRGSGYDRGHLAPSADMPTPAADAQSFLLSNIIAQEPQNNRLVWSAVEAAVRALARHRQVYVITGVLWIGNDVRWLEEGGEKRVMVPTHLYKIVYDPTANKGAGGAAAYLVENAADKRPRQVPIQELEKLARITFFPELPELGSLKLPRPRYGR